MLSQKTPEDRRNELVMLEEFRRRKNLASFRDKQKVIMKQREKEGEEGDPSLDDDYTTDPVKEKEQEAGGPERFFAPSHNETFKTADFTLIFLDSDSVTLVT
jgi:hypothetical protein